MDFSRKIDLHIHTNISDGTDSPAEIIRRVKEEGITLFSVTDHDASEGCTIINEILREGDPDFISGVEFTCEDEEGKYHILGYGYDPDASSIKELIERSRSFRYDYLKVILDYLDSEFGFSFSNEDKEALFSLSNPSKPDVANLMIKYEYASTKNEAVQAYINKCEIKDSLIRPEEAIKAILKAGGIPVLAHAFYGLGDEQITTENVDKRLKRLIRFGLKGIEVFYSGFTHTMQKELLLFAEKYKLYVTAGSNYHGDNKLEQLGDTDLNNYSEYPKRLQKFLKKVNIRTCDSTKKKTIFGLFGKGSRR